MLPEAWSRARIRDVVDASRRVTYGIVQPGPRQARGVPIIRGKDYSGGRVNDTDLYLVSPEVASKYGRSIVRGGDILMSIVGYLGLVAVVPEHLAGANITQTTARIAIAPPNIPEFFFQQFQSRAFQGQIRRYQKGSAQPGLNLADVDKMEVLVPPIPEQQKIATILKAGDDAIAASEAVAGQLDSVRSVLTESLLLNGLPGRHLHYASTDLGRLPSGWRAVRLNDVLTGIDAGWSPACDPEPAGDGEWGVLKISRASWGRFQPEENKRLPAGLAPRPELAVRDGDLIVSRANTKELVGRAVIVEATPPRLQLCDKLLRLRVAPGLAHPAFINAALGTTSARQQIENAATGSSKSMKNISQEALRGLLVPLPPVEEQEAIVAAIEAVGDRIAKERAVAAERRRIKAALTDELLTGTIRVPVQDSA